MESKYDRRTFLRIAGTSLSIGALYSVFAPLAHGAGQELFTRTMADLNKPSHGAAWVGLIVRRCRPPDRFGPVEPGAWYPNGARHATLPHSDMCAADAKAKRWSRCRQIERDALDEVDMAIEAEWHQERSQRPRHLCGVPKELDS
jgi:hypothetical protein